MKNRNAKYAVGVAILSAVSGAAYLIAAPTTIEPPSGPIEGTGHTVTEIYDKLQSLEIDLQSLQLAVSEGAVTSGPWESQYFANATGGSFTITTGPTLIHSVIVYNTHATISNGAGGPVLGSVRSAQLGSSFHATDVQAIFDVVATAGVHVTFSQSGQGPPHATILYRSVSQKKK